MQDLKAKQLEAYKELVISYFRTSENAPWKVRKYEALEGVCVFLKATGVMSEQEDEVIIAEAREEANGL